MNYILILGNLLFLIPVTYALYEIVCFVFSYSISTFAGYTIHINHQLYHYPQSEFLINWPIKICIHSVEGFPDKYAILGLMGLYGIILLTTYAVFNNKEEKKQ